MKRLLLATLLAFSSSTWALDPGGAQRLADLQQRWAQIQYQTPKEQRSEASTPQPSSGSIRARPNR